MDLWFYIRTPAQPTLSYMPRYNYITIQYITLRYITLHPLLYASLQPRAGVEDLLGLVTWFLEFQFASRLVLFCHKEL